MRKQKSKSRKEKPLMSSVEFQGRIKSWKMAQEQLQIARDGLETVVRLDNACNSGIGKAGFEIAGHIAHWTMERMYEVEVKK